MRPAQPYPDAMLLRLLATLFAMVTLSAPAVAGEGQGAAPPAPQPGSAQSAPGGQRPGVGVPGAPAAPDHLDLAIGGGVVFAPRPYVGANATVIPIPVISLRYKRLYAEGIRGGVQALRRGTLTGNVFLQANFEGLEADHSAFLEGMDDRSMSADAGAEIVYRARPIGFRAGVLSDVLGRNKGQEVVVQAVTGAPLWSRGFLLASIGPRWLSANRVDYEYGVRESEATPARPAYTGTSSWNWDLTLGATIRIAGKWSLFTLFSREAFGSPIEQSPIVDGGAAYSLISSLTYALR